MSRVLTFSGAGYLKAGALQHVLVAGGKPAGAGGHFGAAAPQVAFDLPACQVL